MQNEATRAQLLWQPSEQQIANAQITKFRHYVEERFAVSLPDYFSFHRWSVENRSKFWQAWWFWSRVEFRDPFQTPLIAGKNIWDNKWFGGATLNYAANCLNFRDEKLAIIDVAENGNRRTLTYHELYLAVANVANFLRDRGVKPGDRVAAVLPNCSEAIIAFLATSSIGAVWSSCSPDFGEAALLDRFGQIEPKVLIISNGYLFKNREIDISGITQKLQNDLPSVELTIVVDYVKDISQPVAASKASNSAAWQECLNQNAQSIDFHYAAFEQPLAILFSSGTTGKPKCIVHGAGGTLLQHLKEHRLHTDITRNDKFFFFTTCGWMMWNWLVTGLASGATLVLYDGSPVYPTARHLFELAASEKITVFGCSAKLIAALETAKLDCQDLDLTNLRTILTTGSPLMPENFDYVYEHIKKDVCLSSISGGTDIVSCFALGNPTLPVYRGQLQCLGLGMAVSFFSDEGKPLVEKKGELVCTKSFPSMPVGFWQDQDGTKYRNAYFEKFQNIWSHGDFGELTAENGVIIYGRSDAVLNPGGVRIGTAEIYRQAEKHQQVLETLAVGYNEHDDEKVVLFVVLRPGITLTPAIRTEICQLIRTGASPRHVPTYMLQVADLPRTRSGKLSELAVRDVIHGRKVANVGALANPESLQQFADFSAQLQNYS